MGTKKYPPGSNQNAIDSHEPQPKRPKIPQPYVRHPDDYYKYGPFGPYAYKADVVGTPKKARLSHENVTMWSPVKDEAHFEQIAISDAIIDYENRIRDFDEDAELQFFLVFVRQPLKVAYYEPPWKEWTLVSQVTVASGEELDKLTLMSRLHQRIKNSITKCAGWFRPDLVYVKKPRYQVRFEPQREYIKELEKLLEPVGEAHERDSFYGEWCKILGVDVDASHEEVTSKYEQAREEQKLECLGHLFCFNPVQLLHPMPRPGGWVKRDRKGSKTTATKSSTQPRSNLRDNARDGLGRKPDVLHNEVEDEGEGGRRDLDSGEEEEFADDKFEGEYHDMVSDDEDDANSGEEEYEGDKYDADYHDIDKVEVEEKQAVDSWNDEAKGNDHDADLWSKTHDTSYALGENDAESDSDAIDVDVEETDGERQTDPFLLTAAIRPFTYVNLIRETVMFRDILLQEKKNAKN